MKKLFLAIIFSAVLFLGLPFYDVKAMSITYDIPFSAVPDIADLFMGILSGAQYDLSEVSTLEEAAQQHKDSLQQGYHFLQSFATKIWNWQVTQASLGNDSLTQDTDLPIYISISDLANYMDYNIKWWERDKTFTEEIIVNPDLDYISYINTLNGHDLGQFFWFNGGGYLGPNYPTVGFFGNPSDYSWCWISNGNYNNIVINNGRYTSYYVYPLDISDVYIVSYNGTYSFNFSANIVTGLFGSASYGDQGTRRNGGTFEYNSQGVQDWLGGFSDANATTFNLSYNGTLAQCLSYLTTYMRNVNIYVDGVCWSLVSDIPEDYISSPDVYGVGDLGIDIYDVFFPKTDDYGGFSINGFLEWLQGQLGNKDVGLDDLIEDAPDIIITIDENNEPTTRPITYDDTRPVPIVIDGDITADPDPDNPTPTPTPDPTTFPLPPFPKFPIPSDIPNANIQHTVLAEIVEATDNVVPQDLMILIWSTFSLMIIGGIIYILHK